MLMIDSQKARGLMEEINELIQRLGLEEDGEHVIIPFVGSDGRHKRMFILKRRFLRIVYPDGYFLDIPLNAAIESIMRHPEMPLSESLPLTHKDLLDRKMKIVEDVVESEEAEGKKEPQNN
jgi:hypothetical protein